MTTARIKESTALIDLLARACGMEVKSQMQHRTKVNSFAGRPGWVSAPVCATPSFRLSQVGSGSGSGRKWYALTPGELFRSTIVVVGTAMFRQCLKILWIWIRWQVARQPNPEMQSDHLIVALKLANASGAKGMTS
jgi:hypothetical protein